MEVNQNLKISTATAGKKKVFVGMSGGVDSSVSAALLKEAGYEVIGVFIKVWQPPFMECRWPKDRDDARQVASELGIDFTTLNLEDTYKQAVVRYMIEEYKKGRTPNPDVMCNMYVKFGAFFDWAMKEGADFVATGHYAQKISNKKEYQLVKSVDETKDQTYFLWTLGQKQLARTLFPVGEYKKSEVRKLAEQFNLSVANKKDSQGVCFLGKMDMKEFLSYYVAKNPGNVLNTQGEVVGRHMGSVFYTHGERRGFEVTKKSPDTPPLYVIEKDLDKNTITVASEKEIETTYTVNRIELENDNWIAGRRPEVGRYKCRFRHLQELIDCELSFEEKKTIIRLDTPQKAVSEGQSLVLYDGDVCLGGGVIELEV